MGNTVAKVKYEGTLYESQNYGMFKVIEYIDHSTVYVEFIDTGYITKVGTSNIVRGDIKDRLAPSVYGVGYIGNGKYDSGIKGKRSKSYTTWKSMLARCYDNRTLERSPTYRGCVVTPEWHNFQNFAKWYEDNYIEGYHLDKDIKVEGNKVYGPDTCIFATRQENNEKSTAKFYKVVDPTGSLIEVYNMKAFCKLHNLDPSTLKCVITGRYKQHKGWTKYKEENDNAKT